jgi:hypothetical protein
MAGGRPGRESMFFPKPGRPLRMTGSWRKFSGGGGDRDRPFERAGWELVVIPGICRRRFPRARLYSMLIVKMSMETPRTNAPAWRSGSRS